MLELKNIHMNQKLNILYDQLMKGTFYFNSQMLSGPATPHLSRKIVEFERDVIRPFDDACRKASREELIEMEVPF